jgi:hypothetical protein
MEIILVSDREISNKINETLQINSILGWTNSVGPKCFINHLKPANMNSIKQRCLQPLKIKTLNPLIKSKGPIVSPIWNREWKTCHLIWRMMVIGKMKLMIETANEKTRTLYSILVMINRPLIQGHSRGSQNTSRLKNLFSRPIVHLTISIYEHRFWIRSRIIHLRRSASTSKLNHSLKENTKRAIMMRRTNLKSSLSLTICSRGRKCSKW